ncbi:hypothetical protein FISHEDRAFT_56603 [Fistulina hepatica ATCC 64428]|uniref:Senescence domain-containing protein n=1 Tax=Fistulina hepatica ATCC 64428 TaxID=1128425 RepID=A0A0D7AKY5_9AGAR|nr:hypothetical protein FISHEDRAFT_56603 [Fistulina hepatica ATCC 64428]
MKLVTLLTVYLLPFTALASATMDVHGRSPDIFTIKKRTPPAAAARLVSTVGRAGTRRLLTNVRTTIPRRAPGSAAMPPPAAASKSGFTNGQKAIASMVVGKIAGGIGVAVGATTAQLGHEGAKGELNRRDGRAIFARTVAQRLATTTLRAARSLAQSVRPNVQRLVNVRPPTTSTPLNQGLRQTGQLSTKAKWVIGTGAAGVGEYTGGYLTSREGPLERRVVGAAGARLVASAARTATRTSARTVLRNTMPPKLPVGQQMKNVAKGVGMGATIGAAGFSAGFVESSGQNLLPDYMKQGIQNLRGGSAFPSTVLISTHDYEKSPMQHRAGQDIRPISHVSLAGLASRKLGIKHLLETNRGGHLQGASEIASLERRNVVSAVGGTAIRRSRQHSPRCLSRQTRSNQKAVASMVFAKLASGAGVATGAVVTQLGHESLKDELDRLAEFRSSARRIVQWPAQAPSNWTAWEKSEVDHRYPGAGKYTGGYLTSRDAVLECRIVEQVGRRIFTQAARTVGRGPTQAKTTSPLRLSQAFVSPPPQQSTSLTIGQKAGTLANATGMGTLIATAGFSAGLLELSGHNLGPHMAKDAIKKIREVASKMPETAECIMASNDVDVGHLSPSQAVIFIAYPASRCS